MSTQTSRLRCHKQKIREDFLREINSVWEAIEVLEKKSKKTFGERDFMTEILGSTAVHMMNTSFEIENQISKNTNKLSHNSVTKLFETLNIIRLSDPKTITEIQKAYQTAVKKISSNYNVKISTVRDLCVRRLGHVGKGSVDKSFSLVEDWLLNKSTDLSELIKEHSEEHQYDRIDEFFKNGRIIQ